MHVSCCSSACAPSRLCDCDNGCLLFFYAFAFPTMRRLGFWQQGNRFEQM
jgi:hypothetical protein